MPKRPTRCPWPKPPRRFPNWKPTTSHARMAAIRETIDLIETDLAAMIRDVQRAADAVRGGTRATAEVLGAIRGQSELAEALAESSDRERDASCERHGRIRAVVRRDRPAGARGGRADRGCRARRVGRGKERRRAESLVGRDRQRGEPDLGHRQADQSAGAQRHDRGGARGRRGPRLCGGGERSEGALRRDAERHGRNRPQDRSAAARRAGIDRGGQPHHDGDRGNPARVRRGRAARSRSRSRPPASFRAARRILRASSSSVAESAAEIKLASARARAERRRASTVRARMPRTLRRSFRRASSRSCARPKSATAAARPPALRSRGRAAPGEHRGARANRRPVRGRNAGARRRDRGAADRHQRRCGSLRHRARTRAHRRALGARPACRVHRA